MKPTLPRVRKKNGRIPPYGNEQLHISEDVFITTPHIDIKDLRVGNLLKLDDKIIKISTISSGAAPKIGFTIEGMALSEMVFDLNKLHNLLPIAITKSVKERCMFNKSFEIKNRVSHLKLGYVTILPQLLVYYKGVFIVEIFYLHQLQNLYYDLTGEELQINTLK